MSAKSGTSWLRLFVKVSFAGVLGAAVLLLLLFGKALRTADWMLHPVRVPVRVGPGYLSADAREIEFRSGDGLRLSGWYVPSRNGAAVVLAHGHGENRTQLLPEARFLESRGFGILLFDWRAHGNSEGNLSTRGDRELLDFRAAVDWLSGQPDIQADRLGAYGFSRGGNVVLQAAANDARLSAVVAAAAAPSLVEGVRGDLGRWAPVLLWPTIWVMRWKGIRPERLDPVAHMCEIAPRPLLLVTGERDVNTPPAFSEQLLGASCGHAQLWRIPGAGHGEYLRHAGAEYERRVGTFFESALLHEAAIGRQPDVATVHSGH